jgi:hypothetical protein
MVRKNGKDGYRSFTLVGASKTSGCRTKGYGGRFINKSAAGAARKAFTDLCRTKRISGVCTLYITVRDTTKGGKQKGKEYAYKLQRNKLGKPLIRLEGKSGEYVVEYKSSCRAVKAAKKRDCGPSDVSPAQRQTRGRALKRTAKKTRITPNNVRRMSKGKGRRLRSRYVNNNNNQNNNNKPLRRSKRLAAKRM